MTVSLPVELPDNLPACHAVILRQAEVIEELFARIERLNRDLAALKRQLFGSRRERFVADSGEDRAGEEVAVEQRGPPSAGHLDSPRDPEALRHRRPRPGDDGQPAAGVASGRVPTDCGGHPDLVGRT